MNFDSQGYVEVTGGKIWYGIVGKDVDKPPLIILHGGPGFPHNYLEPLAKLSKDRQVIFYDQLGCGNSDKITDLSLLRVDRFVDELQKLVNHLNLKTYHILGQSWGSALAAEFAFTKPTGLQSIVFADPYLSTPMWIEDAKKLKQTLPRNIVETLEEHEKNNTTNSEEYKRAGRHFYNSFVYRLDKLPDYVKYSNQHLAENVYHTMWGKTEWNMTGTLKDFDATNRLSTISVPCLFLCGKYDEATPQSTHFFASLVPNSEVVVFEESAHMPHITEEQLYLQTVSSFLLQNE